jgi:ABC-type microcin C transport system permease subunit YejE
MIDRRFIFAIFLTLTVGLLARTAVAQGNEKPVFLNYKGVTIGMPADEVRAKLGDPQDKSDTQDFYVFSDNESAQVYYDAEKKVSVVSVTYTGDLQAAPIAKTVVGTEISAKPDGTKHLLVRYPKSGYWVSYFRSAGDSPMVVVVMQKM